MASVKSAVDRSARQDALSLQYSTYGGGDVAETNIANIFQASFSTLCDCFLSNDPHT